MVVVLLAGLIFGVLCIYPLWRVFARAGLPPALSLMVFLPFGGFIAPTILAFSQWPNVRPNARPNASSSSH